jgi:hypothetical protein
MKRNILYLILLAKEFACWLVLNYLSLDFPDRMQSNSVQSWSDVSSNLRHWVMTRPGMEPIEHMFPNHHKYRVSLT